MNLHTLRACFLLLLLFILLRHLSANSVLLSYNLADAALPRLLRDDLFSNNPLSDSRPRPDQFVPRSPRLSPPILTLITVSRDPRPVFDHTATAVRSQTLHPLRWLIVNDFTNSSLSYHRLLNASARDPRVVLVNSTATPGFCHGRIFAMHYLRRNPTDFFAFLDDDDLFELTYYEKCAWMLSSASAADMCGSHVVGFGHKNYTWTFGFHSGMRAAIDNPLTGSEVLRTSVLNKTACNFDPTLTSGMEDWDFYLCLASNGAWGATIPERLMWYRQNPAALRRQRWNALFDKAERTGSAIRTRYAKLATPAMFPRVTVPAATELEPINTTAPFANRLAPAAAAPRRSAVVLTSWLAPGPTSAATLRLVKRLRALGFRVSVACTLHDPAGEHAQAWRASFLRYTPDVFFLPAMLRLPDAPRFLAYLVRSRGASLVVVAHSRLAYGALPWLCEQFRRAVCVDFVAADEPRIRNGGYVALSTIHASSLDRTLAANQAVREALVRRGRDGRHIEVLHDGIGGTGAAPMRGEERAVTRRKLRFALSDVVVVAGLLGKDSIGSEVLFPAFARAVRSAHERMGPKGLSCRVRLVVIGEASVHGEHWKELGELSRDVTVATEESALGAGQHIRAADVVALPKRNGDISVARGEQASVDDAVHVHTQAEVVRMVRDALGAAKVVSTRAKRDGVTEMLGKFVRDTILDAYRGRTSVEPADEQQALWTAGERERRDMLRWLTARRRGGRRGGTAASEALRQLQYAQSAIVRELRALSDFGVAQNELQGKPRGQFGAMYRAKCGEWDGVVSKLIDMLERPVACVGGTDLRVERLHQEALAQCARWCIMDGSDGRNQSGWQVVDKCGIKTFDDASHKCSLWYKQTKKPARR